MHRTPVPTWHRSPLPLLDRKVTIDQKDAIHFDDVLNSLETWIFCKQLCSQEELGFFQLLYGTQIESNVVAYTELKNV